MKAWSHLPNAHHIDWVLVSVRVNTKLWDATWSAARRVTRSEARVATWDSVKGAARENVWTAARFAARDAAFDAAFDAALDVISALVAYDDCDQFLNMSYEKLKVWAVLSEDPRAILLLPMIYVKEKLNEQSMVSSA